MTRASVLVTVTTFFSVLTGSAQQAGECITRITLLQVNDVYQFAPVDRGIRGGLARVMTLKKQIQKESPHTLFFLWVTPSRLRLNRSRTRVLR